MKTLRSDGELLPGKATLTDDPRAERRLAMIVGGGFFIGFLGWAALTPLDSAVYAQGIVAVSGNRQAVQYRDSGVVTALNVRDGQFVVQGQPLLAVSSADIEAEERSLLSEYVTLLAQRARLVAERRDSPRIAVPAEFSSLPASDRTLGDEALRDQSDLLRARRASRAGQISVLQQRSAQSGAQIGGYSAEIAANREQYRLIQLELDGLRQLSEKGFASKNRIRALERTAAELEGNRGSYAAEIARTRGAIGETRMQELLIDKNVIQEVDEQYRDLSLRLNEVRPKLAAARERLARTIVRAPTSGKVVGLSIFTVGGVIGAGQTLMEIVPQDRKLVIKARLSPADADDIFPGLETQVRFPTLRSAQLPTMSGRLATLSADSLVDERTGAAYFGAEVLVTESELGKLPPGSSGGPPIQAGLPAEVLIPLQKRTMLQFLLEPLLRATWRTGREH